MTDLDKILPLWQELRASGSDYVLATVVAVEGSGYRKPGARMLMSIDGRRAGTISGGCLEADVAKKAFWHTENGPVIRRYSTRAEDGEVPFGMGCGGVVYLLLERCETAGPMIERLAACFAERQPIAIATVQDGPQIGKRVYFPSGLGENAKEDIALLRLAQRAFDLQRSIPGEVALGDGQTARVWAEFSAARPGLFVFGAGDDAKPFVTMARQLGWFVVLADGRSHLATQARFPEAHETHVLTPGPFPTFLFRPTDTAAIMTHSLQQDTRILNAVLSEGLAYVGVLGPRRRTCDMLEAIAEQRNLPKADVELQVLEWMGQVHAPMGLDLGGETPAAIALAIISEIQQTLRQTTGRPLREIRSRIEDPAMLSNAAR